MRFMVMVKANKDSEAGVLPDEKLLNLQLHELLTYLGQLGIATLLVSVQRGVLGTQMTSSADTSYLADTVLVLRYFEAQGEVRQAISVLKKRSGQHERAIREFTLARGGVQVGPALNQFHGVLTGVPIAVEDRRATARDDLA